MFKLTALRDLFFPPSAKSMAKTSLEIAERDLVRWRAAHEESEAMVLCLQHRVNRLKEELGQDRPDYR